MEVLFIQCDAPVILITECTSKINMCADLGCMHACFSQPHCHMEWEAHSPIDKWSGRLGSSSLVCMVSQQSSCALFDVYLQASFELY